MVFAYIVKNSKFAYRERDEEQKDRARSWNALLTSAAGDANMIIHWVYFFDVLAENRGSISNDFTALLLLLILGAISINGIFWWWALSSDGRFLHHIWRATRKIGLLLLLFLKIIYSIVSKVVCCISYYRIEFSDAAFDRELVDKWDTYFEQGFCISSATLLIFFILLDHIPHIAMTYLIEYTIGHGDFSTIACVNVTITAFDILHKMVEAWVERKLYIRTGTGARTLTGHKGEVFSLVAVGPDDRFAVSASNDGKIKLWDLDSYKRIATVDLKDSEINVTRLRDDKIVTTSSDPGGEIKIYDINTASANSNADLIDCYNEEAMYYGGVRCTTGSSSGDFFLTSKLENKKTILGTKVGNELELGSEFLSEDSYEVSKWNAATPTQERTYPIRADFLVILDNDQHFVSANSRKSQEGRPTLWDIDSGDELRHFNIANQESRVTAMCKHSDDDSLFLVASSNQEDEETFVDMFRGDLEDSVATMEIEGYGIGIITSIGGHRFVYSNNHQAHLCDISSGSRLHTFIGHRMGINAIVYLPEKKSIATASCDRTIKVWPIPNHDGDVRRPFLDNDEEQQ